ncbi:P-loop containing nucleoside triphosphate hydrolase protein [Pavlovales sp. CCMP2436]|nr:P-loop containing nucleoside triphosphate hydrolase protein [Pavlovales sp. CCMP2436]
MFVRLERFRATSALPPPAGFEARAVRPPPPRACLALIVLPLVTLAREWHLRLQRLTKGVEGFYQHHGSLPLGPYVRIAVCTIERAVGLVRSLEEEGRLAELVTVVVDEIHLVTEASRGPRLELLMSKLLYVAARSQGRLQLLGMSATVPNIELFARWLRAELHHESCRPQVLRLPR